MTNFKFRVVDSRVGLDELGGSENLFAREKNNNAWINIKCEHFPILPNKTNVNAIYVVHVALFVLSCTMVCFKHLMYRQKDFGRIIVKPFWCGHVLFYELLCSYFNLFPIFISPVAFNCLLQ
jgi:hypothetical protein